MDLPKITKYTLNFSVFHRCILVVLLRLVFLLDRSTQYKPMKIGFTFFRAKIDLICIYKFPTLFWIFLKWLKCFNTCLFFEYTAFAHRDKRRRLNVGSHGSHV